MKLPGEYLQEMWDHRADSYWWLDHQLELAVVVVLLTGSLGLAFKYLELRMVRGMSPDA